MSGRLKRIDEVILTDEGTFARHDDFVRGDSGIVINVNECGLALPKEIDAVEIGRNHWKGPVNISNIDLRKLVERVETLESLVEQQSELINAMWYHPGMPGADEIEEKFRANVEKLSLAKQ